MELSPLVFYIFAGLAIACSLLVVFKTNPVSSAFSLVLVFFSFAAIYAGMSAHLLAALQIVLYTGAIMVLFVFVIMLLGADVPSLDFKKTSVPIRVVAATVTATILGVFVWGFRSSSIPYGKGDFSPEAIEAAGGNTRVISEVMFSEFILPFEITSILLLAAMIGTVAIAKRKLGK